MKIYNDKNGGLIAIDTEALLNIHIVGKTVMVQPLQREDIEAFTSVFDEELSEAKEVTIDTLDNLKKFAELAKGLTDLTKVEEEKKEGK